MLHDCHGRRPTHMVFRPEEILTVKPNCCAGPGRFVTAADLSGNPPIRRVDLSATDTRQRPSARSGRHGRNGPASGGPVRSTPERTRCGVSKERPRYGPSGSGRAGTRSVGSRCSPDKPMLLISSSHEKQTAIRPKASRDREFYVNKSE